MSKNKVKSKTYDLGEDIKYKVINAPRIPNAPANYKFVYLLCFEKNNKLIPFYVGITDNFLRRFNHHQFVMWYYAKFEERVNIYLAGIVKDTESILAEQALIQCLIERKISLANTQITNKKARQLNQAIFNIKEAKQVEIINYIDSFAIDYDFHQSIASWNEKWEITSTPKVVHPYVDTVLLREQLTELPSKLKLNLTEEELDLHYQFCYEYNFNSGSTTHILTNRQVIRIKELQKIWSIKLTDKERENQQNGIWLRASSIEEVVKMAKLLNPDVMNSKVGEKANKFWKASPPKRNELAVLQRQARNQTVRINKLRRNNGSQVAIDNSIKKRIMLNKKIQEIKTERNS